MRDHGCQNGLAVTRVICREASRYPADAPASQDLFDRARAIVPGGVNSPVRAFRAVGGTPRFMVRGEGPYLFDADGRRYVDLVSLLGPADPRPRPPGRGGRASPRRPRRGTSFGTPTPGEVDLAEEIVARTPVEQVRLVNSGTEATMSAIRLARGGHRPLEDRQVRRVLPRARRRPARRGRLGRGHARAARLARA